MYEGLKGTGLDMSDLLKFIGVNPTDALKDTKDESETSKAPKKQDILTYYKNPQKNFEGFVFEYINKNVYENTCTRIFK